MRGALTVGRWIGQAAVVDSFLPVPLLRSLQRALRGDSPFFASQRVGFSIVPSTAPRRITGSEPHTDAVAGGGTTPGRDGGNDDADAGASADANVGAGGGGGGGAAAVETDGLAEARAKS